ncbi:MAG TPA: hypothetical protein VNV37_11095, partial [Solirubrobacteraceae bacterium]|nr:hypothetical protein [Solirubrobacteraceae bacterium]
MGGDQPVLAEKAALASPEAARAREESRLKFSGLNTEQAAAADAESFPEVIDHPVGGPPPLPAGGQVLGYASTNAAELALPGGKSAVVESMQPMAVETSPGDRLPVDLSLSEVGGGYESVRPVVGVVVPRRSSGGVQLPEAGLSLTAVDVQGSPLGGAEGVDEGGSVVYANTQTDTDTIVKPTTAGFDADTVLRSVDSPGQLYFRVGLPEGASLVQAQGMGQVSVLEGGQRIAVVRAPSAVDAAGTLVPVSMSVEGDLLVLSVSVSPEDDEWPIMVDPEVIKETE